MADKCVALGLTPSFGFGDRTGLATPGHVASMKRCGAGMAAIFPQQSIREMTRTKTQERIMERFAEFADGSGEGEYLRVLWRWMWAHVSGPLFGLFT